MDDKGKVSWLLGCFRYVSAVWEGALWIGIGVFLIRAGGLCNINSSLIVWIDKAALPVRITEGGLTDRLQRARGIIE